MVTYYSKVLFFPLSIAQINLFQLALTLCCVALILLLFRGTASTTLWTRLMAQYQLPSDKGFPAQLHCFLLCQRLASIFSSKDTDFFNFSHYTIPLLCIHKV